MPDVSVLMAVHNGMPYLPIALASIGMQGVPRMEVVLIDDASTDESLGIMEAWLDNSKLPGIVLINQHQVGLTRSLTAGLAVCHGDYVCRQDADDVSLRGRLALQVAFLEAHPDVVVAATRYSVIGEAGEFIRHGCQARWFPRILMMLGRNPIAHGSAMFRRDVALAAGGYQETWDRAQDISLWLRMGRFGKIKVLPEAYYSLREHPGRVSQEHQGQQAAYATLARWANRRR